MPVGDAPTAKPKRSAVASTRRLPPLPSGDSPGAASGRSQTTEPSQANKKSNGSVAGTSKSGATTRSRSYSPPQHHLSVPPPKLTRREQRKLAMQRRELEFHWNDHLHLPLTDIGPLAPLPGRKKKKRKHRKNGGNNSADANQLAQTYPLAGHPLTMPTNAPLRLTPITHPNYPALTYTYPMNDPLLAQGGGGGDLSIMSAPAGGADASMDSTSSPQQHQQPHSPTYSPEQVAAMVERERHAASKKMTQDQLAKERQMQMAYMAELEKERERALEKERELMWEREKAALREKERERELERQKLLDAEVEEARNKAREAEREREKAERWALDRALERERELERQREWEREQEREKERQKLLERERMAWERACAAEQTALLHQEGEARRIAVADTDNGFRDLQEMEKLQRGETLARGELVKSEVAARDPMMNLFALLAEEMDHKDIYHSELADRREIELDQLRAACPLAEAAESAHRAKVDFEELDRRQEIQQMATSELAARRARRRSTLTTRQAGMVKECALCEEQERVARQGIEHAQLTSLVELDQAERVAWRDLVAEIGGPKAEDTPQPRKPSRVVKDIATEPILQTMKGLMTNEMDQAPQMIMGSPFATGASSFPANSPHKARLVNVYAATSPSAASAASRTLRKPDPANNDPRLRDAEGDIDVPDPRYDYTLYNHITNNRAFTMKLLSNMHAHVPTDFTSL